MAVVEVLALASETLDCGLWICPSCSPQPTRLDPQDEAVYRGRPTYAKTKQEALQAMVHQHNQAVGHQARVISGPRQYLLVECGDNGLVQLRMPYS